jgi:hypothetical protein
LKRIKPIGEEWEDLVRNYTKVDHKGKLEIAQNYGVSYDLLKHWISNTKDSGESLQIEAGELNAPLKLNTKSQTKTLAVIGDLHYPYQDDQVLKAVEDFLVEQKPDYLIYNGDIGDFYQVSDFAKEPKRLGELQEDINQIKAMFARHKRLLPGTKKILLAGTHEFRWEKYLQKHAPALADLDAMSIEELYNLEEYGIEYIDYERGLLVNGIFLIIHGDIVAVESGYTAKRHMDKKGGSGICNHTHRGGSHYKRDRFGTYGWWENFCLCTLNPDWIQNPDWQQGFSLVHFTADDRFWVEQIPIIKGKFLYGGELYA